MLSGCLACQFIFVHFHIFENSLVTYLKLSFRKEGNKFQNQTHYKYFDKDAKPHQPKLISTFECQLTWNAFNLMFNIFGLSKSIHQNMYSDHNTVLLIEFISVHFIIHLLIKIRTLYLCQPDDMTLRHQHLLTYFSNEPISICQHTTNNIGFFFFECYVKTHKLLNLVLNRKV